MVQNNDNIKIIKELTEEYPSLLPIFLLLLQYHNHEGFINLFPSGILHAIIFACRVLVLVYLMIPHCYCTVLRPKGFIANSFTIIDDDMWQANNLLIISLSPGI